MGGSELLRPFLPNKPGQPLSAPDASSSADIGVRAYLITGGRTDVTARPMAYETMLTVKERERAVHFERASIVDLCGTTALSVAEISARLHLPIGVVRVLASDMVSEGILSAHAGAPDKSNDISLLTRLINGVRAL
jgi:Protein of unknown function (DUF742)